MQRTAKQAAATVSALEAAPVVEVLEPSDVPALDALMDALTANIAPVADPSTLAPPLPDPSDVAPPVPDPLGMVEPLKEWPAPPEPQP